MQDLLAITGADILVLTAPNLLLSRISCTCSNAFKTYSKHESLLDAAAPAIDVPGIASPIECAIGIRLTLANQSWAPHDANGTIQRGKCCIKAGKACLLRSASLPLPFDESIAKADEYVKHFVSSCFQSKLVLQCPHKDIRSLGVASSACLRHNIILCTTCLPHSHCDILSSVCMMRHALTLFLRHDKRQREAMEGKSTPL